MKRKILSVVISALMLLTVLTCALSASLSASAYAYEYERDTTWYDPTATELVIEDIPDFIEFMYQLEEQGTTDDGSALNGGQADELKISWDGKMPFEGQTIILATDIILNDGIRFTADGPSNDGAFCFVRNDKEIGFGGTFDGAGHTISGLYITSTTYTGGSIFGIAGAAFQDNDNEVMVKNLQVKNSYITSTKRGVGTIFSGVAYSAYACIENVYSTAILDSQVPIKESAVLIGGLCGEVGGALTIYNSVYSGDMKCLEDSIHVRKGIGGLVGYVRAEVNSDMIHNGEVRAYASGFYGSVTMDAAAYVGKVVGDFNGYSDSVLNVRNCILAGDISIIDGHEIGIVAGMSLNQSNILVNNTVYTPIIFGSSSVTDTIGNADEITVNGSPKRVLDTDLVGEYSMSVLGGEMAEYWVADADANGYPLPKELVDTFGVASLRYDFVSSEIPSSIGKLLAVLGDKKINNGEYVASSYSAYERVYDDITSRISQVEINPEPYTVEDVLADKAYAEGLLITVEEYRESILEKLGEKKSNNNGQYTQASYAAYSAAYDNIVSDINAAGSNIDSINVYTRRDAAEAKLQLATDADKVVVTNKNEAASTNVSIGYVVDSTVNTIYSVDVIWNDIKFTYNTVVPQWDPEIHEYVMPTGKSGWSDSSGHITVINHSNVDVNVDIAFAALSDANGTAKLKITTPSFVLGNAVGTDVASAPSKTVAITATGTPKQNGIIGKLIVRVN